MLRCWEVLKEESKGVIGMFGVWGNDRRKMKTEGHKDKFGKSTEKENEEEKGKM